VDLIIDRRSNPHVLEVNTIPGMTETSLLPKIAKNAGIEFPELIQRILGDR
jgi:D-alanine-D-alanine ligase